MKLRTKFILILLALIILPALAVAWFASNLLDKALAIGLSREVSLGLDAAVGVMQQSFRTERDKLTAEMRALAEAVRLATPQSISTTDSSHSVALLDSMGRIERSWPTGAILPSLPALPSLPLLPDSLSDLGSDSSAIRLALGLPNGRALIGERSLPTDLREKSRAIMNAAQYFSLIDLERRNLQHSLILAFLVIYAPMLCMSLIVGWYLAARVTSPVEALVEGARRLAKGDWQHRVAVRSRDEIGEMGRSFNTMVAELQRQQEQMIALEKMAAWREIARVLAHEIKNPLTPIQLMVQQLQDEYREGKSDYGETLQESTRIISEELEKLRRLVREFSDFARMPELHPTSGQLNELIREIAKLYPAQRVKFELAATLPSAQFDWEAMRRVLINLIENALQSSPSAEVILRTQASSEFAEIEVKDNGPGIPADNLKRIFEPYFSTKKSGMGLGLAIVKRIVEEHHGRITVNSEVGRGTNFVVRLLNE